MQDSDNLLAQQIPVKGGQELALTLTDVQAALDKLAPEHKEILLLIGITELSYDEAAEICGVAIGTVKSRLNRARAKLAEHLGLLTHKRHRHRSHRIGPRSAPTLPRGLTGQAFTWDARPKNSRYLTVTPCRVPRIWQRNDARP